MFRWNVGALIAPGLVYGNSLAVNPTISLVTSTLAGDFVTCSVTTTAVRAHLHVAVSARPALLAHTSFRSLVAASIGRAFARAWQHLFLTIRSFPALGT